MIQRLVSKIRTVKPGKYKCRGDALDIFITDFQVHAQKATNPKSLIRSHVQQLKSGKGKRAYSTSIRDLGNGRIETSFDFEEDEIINYLNKTGKRMLRIYMPTEGVPVYMSQDATEKLKSLQRKLLNN